ncbi:MAG: hypothetical protein OEZ68_17550 [Gammaproteobacteria bacterium]|nr:hypothetical protein [Gammaproteobacteria bacterium]MDH5802610.1 hypothetical protein [Gammaproteobacteria bacterium]
MNRWRRLNWKTVSVSGLVLLIFSALLWADTLHRLSTEALKQSAFLSGESGDKLLFEFQGADPSKAWLKQNGQWQIEAWVRHNHFRCGHYQLGVRFGQGEPACLNVKWLTDPVFISNKRQCNNSVIHHKGSESSEELEKLFSKITCAEQVIKCVGICD